MAKILQLKEFVINRLHVDFRHGTHGAMEGTPEADRLSFDYDVLFNIDQEGLMALALTVHLEAPQEEDEAGYIMESMLFGVFDASELPADSLEYLIRVNGAMILYGLLRGQIAATTGSFPRGPLLLPSVDMREVVEAVEARKAAEVRKAARKSKASSKTSAKKRAASKKKSTSKSSAPP